MTEAVINNGCLAHNCIYNNMINSIVIFHHLSQCRKWGHLHLIFGGVHPHRSCTVPLSIFSTLFHCSPKAVFQYWLRFLRPHQAMNVFSIFKNAWNISFRKKLLQVVSEQCITYIFTTPSQSLVSGHISCLKYMRAGGWLGLWDYD